jgi:hypothetical protein
MIVGRHLSRGTPFSWTKTFAHWIAPAPSRAHTILFSLTYLPQSFDGEHCHGH